MATRMPINAFLDGLYAALKRGDGYIMGATGQDPKTWAKTSSWFTQYSGSQKDKALYWREHAARVWDCNGLAEGLYKDFTGVSINTQARYNYANWCDPKGKGMIPAAYRVPGAAVFWSDGSAGSIHHVAYLVEPVNASNPNGDWYLIEARGVTYGVVKTKLLSRKPNFWGLMTKYFDYEGFELREYSLGDRILKNGCEGADVKELQLVLIALGYDCGRWGADGDYGDATELAVLAFQNDAHIDVDGEVGPQTVKALMDARLQPVPEDPQSVIIVNGNCYVRTAPNTSGEKLGVVHPGEQFAYGGQTSPEGWNKIVYREKTGWVSGKYSKVV